MQHITYKGFFTLFILFAFILSGCGGSSDQTTEESQPKIREFSQIKDLIRTNKISELIKLVPDDYTPLPDQYIFLGDNSLNIFITILPIENKNDDKSKAYKRAILEILENNPDIKENIKSGKYILSYKEVEKQPIVELLDPENYKPLYTASNVIKEPIDSANLKPGPYSFDIEGFYDNGRYIIFLSFVLDNYHIKASFEVGNLNSDNTSNEKIVTPDGTVIDIILLIKNYMEEDSKLFNLERFNPDKMSVLITPDTIVALAPTLDGAFGYIKIGYEGTDKAPAVRLLTEGGYLKIIDSLGQELLSDKVDHDIQTYGGTKRIGISYDPFSKNKIEIHCECENAKAAPGGCIRRPLPDPWPDPFPIPY